MTADNPCQAGRISPRWGLIKALSLSPNMEYHFDLVMTRKPRHHHLSQEEIFSLRKEDFAKRRQAENKNGVTEEEGASKFCKGV